MINLSDCLKKYPVQRIIDSNKEYAILENKNKEQLLVLEKNKRTKELFSYFESISYNCYDSFINDEQDSYELYLLKEDTPVEVLHKMISLHTKTQKEEKLSSITKTILYEEIKRQIEEQIRFFETIQNQLEQPYFPKIDSYYLLENLRYFYASFQQASNYLEQWYQDSKSTIRKALLLQETKYYYEYSYNIMILDFVSFYRKFYPSFDSSLWEEYQQKMNLNSGEKNLLFCLLLIPEEIGKTSSTYQNTVNIHRVLEYLDQALSFVSEENKNNQETD